MAAAIKRAKRPVIYAGGGVISGDASDELRELVRKTGIPVTMTVMGLGAFPRDDPLSLDMLGMHGSVYANYAVDQADLLMALGVRFDDRVTGKVAEFAKHGKIVHVDIDPSEINKNKEAHIPIVSDVKYALAELNKIVEAAGGHLGAGMRRCDEWKQERSVQLRPEASRASCRSTRSASCGELTHRSRHDRHRRRRPASDVGGPVSTSSRTRAPGPLQLRPGHDGLWPAGGDGRQGRLIPTSWWSTSTATAAS